MGLARVAAQNGRDGWRCNNVSARIRRGNAQMIALVACLLVVGMMMMMMMMGIDLFIR